MRKHAPILFFFALSAMQQAIAQEKQLLSHPYQTKIKKGTVKDYLDEINASNGVTIEYASNNLHLDQTFEVDGTENTIGRILQTILRGQQVRLLEKNHKLILAPSAVPINTDALVPSYTVYGFVRENGSKEPMMNATITETEGRGTITSDDHGYFNFSLPEGNHRLVMTYAGFSPRVINVSLHGNTRLDVDMSPGQSLQEVVVTRENQPRQDASDLLPANPDRNNYDYFMGSNDPLRNAYLLPGVLNVGDNFAGLVVRGGGADENLFLLDGVQVYNPSHMMGALSIINPTSLKNLQLYKSDFPARFNGSLSSVLDVYTKDGNMQQWHGEANIGILSASVGVEGPLVNNKTAIMASFRHSWLSSLWSQYSQGLKPEFYDVNLKLTQWLDKNNKLILDFYKGQDLVYQTASNTDNLHQWGNMLGSVRWNHLISSRSFLTFSADYSQYDNQAGYSYNVQNDQEETVQTKSLGTLSWIQHYTARLDADIYLSSRSRVNAGLRYDHTIDKPFDRRVTAELENDVNGFNTFQPLAFDEYSGYAEWEYRPSRHLVIRPGMHLTQYVFNDFYQFSLQPRFFAGYQFNNAHQVFASYARMTQYMHLVANPFLGMNADMWVPSTALLQPEQSETYNLGYAFNSRGKFRFSLTGYWKNLEQVTNFANGKTYFVSQDNWQQSLISGRGWSYGMESVLQWSTPRISSYISYTLSWSWRQFDSVNNGNAFPYKYDRRHVLNLGATYHISKRFDISGLWSFATGDAVLLPSVISTSTGPVQGSPEGEDPLSQYQFLYQYSNAALYRTPDYQRLDGSVSYHSRNLNKIQTIITAGFYDVYGSPDQYAFDLLARQSSNTVSPETRTFYVGLFPYLSITVRF